MRGLFNVARETSVEREIMAEVDVLISAAFIVVRIISCVLVSILWRYLKSKPMARQTFWDEMVKELILSHFLSAIFSDFCIRLNMGPFSETTAIILTLFNMFLAFNFLAQTCITFLVRYFLIFFSWVSLRGYVAMSSSIYTMVWVNFRSILYQFLVKCRPILGQS